MRFDDAPPDLIKEKLEIGKILNFGTLPPQQKKQKLKHLKLPENHFKTNNLFFVQPMYLKSTLHLGKPD